MIYFIGFGAPVPRTTIGRTATVIFAAIGIPAHFLLIMNVGLLLAIRLQRYAISRKFLEYDQKDPKYLAPIPKWVKVVPFVFGGKYKIISDISILLDYKIDFLLREIDSSQVTERLS